MGSERGVKKIYLPERERGVPPGTSISIWVYHPLPGFRMLSFEAVKLTLAE